MAAIALFGWGCDVCATSERMAIFENLPMCPTEAESDAGVVDAPGEGPWTFSGEEQRWREPDRTSPVIIPVDVHIPENVQRVLPLSPRQYRVEVSGDGCLPGHDVVAQMGASFRIEWPDRLIETFSTECRIKPRNGRGPQALANEYLAELGQCAQESDFEQPDGNGGSWRWTNPLDPRFDSTAEAYVHAQDRLFSCAAEACAAVNDFDAEDADDDGLNDTCDACLGHHDSDDLDDDGVPDGCDNCAAVPNPEQFDSDADEIGDACCGDDDPDADGIGNCDYYPPDFLASRDFESQAGAPEVDQSWASDAPVPGQTVCDPTGYRVCMPAGTWRGDIEAESIPGTVEQLIAMGGPNVHHLPRGDDDYDWRIADCSRICVLAGGARGCEWDLEAMRECIESPPMAKAALEVEIDRFGTGTRASFGLMGQFAIYHMGGYATRGCRYDFAYRVVHRGHQRRGSMDILCDSNIRFGPDGVEVLGEPGQAIEVKWYHTGVTWWHNDRIKSFIDQTERHHAYWNQRSVLDPSMRMVWMFGFNPPSIARRILEHDAYPFEPKMAAFPGNPSPTYPSIPRVTSYHAIFDRMNPSPWLAGRYYWTTFIPTDFREIRGILDEGPTLDCDRDILYCDWLGLFGADDEVNEATFTRLGRLYVEMPSLKRFMGRYLARCVEAGPERAALGCNESMELMYDAIKGAGF